MRLQSDGFESPPPDDEDDEALFNLDEKLLGFATDSDNKPNKPREDNETSLSPRRIMSDLDENVEATA